MVNLKISHLDVLFWRLQLMTASNIYGVYLGLEGGSLLANYFNARIIDLGHFVHGIEHLTGRSKNISLRQIAINLLSPPFWYCFIGDGG
jgi:hypothetical protein